MSGKPDTRPSTEPSSRPVRPNPSDPRVRRTREALGDALVELVRKKPYHDIIVQEVLDRAGVGRTTFYTHYRDKQDLFLSDVEEFLESISNLLERRVAASRRIAPVEELFAHVADVHDFYDALAASGNATVVRELGIGYLARSIEKRLTAAGVTRPPSEHSALSQALAGALFSMLEWWIRQGETAPSPANMDVLFHDLVWQGIGKRP